MANSYVFYSSDVVVGQTDFAYSIKTIATADIKVAVDGVVQTTGYSLIGATTDSGGTVRFDAGQTGVSILIYRETPTGTIPTDFTDGSILTEADLDKNFNFVHYIGEESAEKDTLDLDYTHTNYDAAGKKVINVGEGSLGTDAVNVDMLNRTALSGGAFAVPQVWTFLEPTVGQTAFVLDASTGSGTPQGTEDNFYIVSVGGVVQDPDDDFDVTETGGVFTCTLSSGVPEDADTGDGVPVFIRNFGVSRQYLEQPIIPVDSSAAGVEIKAPTSVYTGRYLKINRFDGTEVAAIYEGSSEGNIVLRLGTTTTADNTALSAQHLEIGDVITNSTTSRGILGYAPPGANYSYLAIQGNSGTGLVTSAFRIYRSNKESSRIDYGGTVHCTALEAHGTDVTDTNLTGPIKGGDTTITGDATISGGLTVGSGGNQFVVDATGTVDNTTSFTSNTYKCYAVGEMALYPHNSVADIRSGAILFTPHGGQLHNYNSASGASTHCLRVADDRCEVVGSALDLNNNRIIEVGTPTADTDAATKGYVDSQAGVLGRWNFIASTDLVGDTTAFQTIATGLAAYERIRFEFRGVQQEAAAAGPSDPGRLFIQFRNSSAVICELHDDGGTAVGTQGAHDDHGILSISTGSGGMVIDNFLEGYNLTGSIEMYGHDSGDQQGIIHSEFHHHSFDHTSQDLIAGYLTQEVNTDVIDEMRMLVARGDGAGSASEGTTDYRGFASGQVRVYGMNYPTS